MELTAEADFRTGSGADSRVGAGKMKGKEQKM